MTQAPLFDVVGQLESLIDMISAECDDLSRLAVYAYGIPSDPSDEEEVDIDSIAEAKQSVIEMLQEHFNPTELEMRWFEEPLSLTLRLDTSNGNLAVETGPL